MRITDARYEYGKLILDVQYGEATQWLETFKPNRDWDIKIHRDRRSNNANSYAWTLINQIGQKMNIPAIEVYRTAIADIGGKTEECICKPKAYVRLRETFLEGHIGRSMEVIGEVDVQGERYYSVEATYGSSDYDSRQMSQLIDSLTFECKQLGIPTLDDIKLQQLIDEWG